MSDRHVRGPASVSADMPLDLLPLYLAGVQRLLVLAGPTYLSRLWWCGLLPSYGTRCE